MSEADNLLEILLRLVHGERATPFSQSAPAMSSSSVSGPLLAALSQGSAHGAQQTHVSLAVLAMFHMATDFAKKSRGRRAGQEPGRHVQGVEEGEVASEVSSGCDLGGFQGALTSCCPAKLGVATMGSCKVGGEKWDDVGEVGLNLGEGGIASRRRRGQMVQGHIEHSR
ncbi:hypothetical protein OF83DRAFT_1083390 [Amylostereum chailletii]|nr:hypothetical protein OF83DRAFT_1083390 [Amylostereum chailletii]